MQSEELEDMAAFGNGLGRVLKQHLETLMGLPRFRQRLLLNGQGFRV